MLVRKFWKKPVVIEAMEWSGTAESATPVINWILDGGGTASYRDESEVHGNTLSIPTLEGVMRAHSGDFIIRGVQGEFYPCRSDIFAQTYEAIDAFRSDKWRPEKAAQGFTGDFSQAPHE